VLEQGSLRAPAGQHNELVLKSYMHTATKKVGWQIQSFSFSPSVGIAQLEGKLHHLDAMHHTVSQYRGRRDRIRETSSEVPCFIVFTLVSWEYLHK